MQLMRCCKTTGPVNSLFLELKCFMNKNNGAKALQRIEEIVDKKSKNRK